MAASWMPSYRAIALTLLIFLQSLHTATAELQLNLGSDDSIKSASKALADSLMAFYNGDQPGGTPGLLPPSVAGDYNWWQAGAMWGQMIEYWYYTGDSRYNKRITDGILAQRGDLNNFEPQNQTRTEGNDDQAFWAFAAMTAAEMKFPDPVDGPSWLSLAQAVFNRQVVRWDDAHCNGGLRWQFNNFNNGWMEKNTISNGCFFQLAARLAKYTGNQTYADWAEKTYEWLQETGDRPLISKNFEVFDGVGFSEKACDGAMGMIQWTYNIGTMIAGTSFMVNFTKNDQKWRGRLDGFLKHTQEVFFPKEYGGNIMVEYACEVPKNCNKDQRSFKAYLSRWLAVAAQIAPYSAGKIRPWLEGSAQAAAKACTNTPQGLACGRTWFQGKDDGERDVGNQMTAMSVVQSNMIWKAKALVDIKDGDSKADPNAGNPTRKPLPHIYTRKMTTADKAGAWTLTVVACLLSMFGVFALLFEGEDIPAHRFLGGRTDSRFSWR